MQPSTFHLLLNASIRSKCLLLNALNRSKCLQCILIVGLRLVSRLEPWKDKLDVVELATKRYLEQAGYADNKLVVRGVGQLYEYRELFCDGTLLAHCQSRTQVGWIGNEVVMEGPIQRAAEHIAQALKKVWHAEGVALPMQELHIQRSEAFIQQALAEAKVNPLMPCNFVSKYVLW